MSDKFDELIQMLAGSMENAQVNKVPVGTVSPELLAEFRQYAQKKDKLRKDIERKLNALRREAEVWEEEMADIQDKLWERTYAELQLDSTQHHSIDKDTGIVSVKQSKGKRGNLRGI